MPLNEWGSRFISSVIQHQQSWVKHEDQNEEELLCRCVTPLLDPLYVFAGSGVRHLRCWISWLGAKGSPHECLILLFTGGANNKQLVVADDLVSEAACEFANVKLSVLPVQHTRFPALKLSATIELIESVINWFDRIPINQESSKHICLAGCGNSSRPLYFYLVYRLWQSNRNDAGDNLQNLIDQLDQLEEKEKMNNTTVATTFHPPVSVSTKQLFPSQRLMLNHWAQLFKGDLVPEIHPIKLLGLNLLVECPSSADTGTTQPIVEIYLSDSAIWSSKPSQSLAWTQIHPNDITALKLHTVQPLRQSNNQTIWTIQFKNAPTISGDYMVRVLPASQDSHDSLFAIPRKSTTAPQWMLRSQYHASMFSHLKPNQTIALPFSNEEIDGFDIIRSSLENLGRTGPPLSLRITWNIEIAQETKICPGLQSLKQFLDHGKA